VMCSCEDGNVSLVGSPKMPRISQPSDEEELCCMGLVS
jgi:hypothetical protein